MNEYANLKLEYLLTMITTEGMRLYEKLKGNPVNEFQKREIEEILGDDEDDEIIRKAEKWLEKLEEAVADINENTDIKIEVELDGEMVRFKRK